MARRPPGPRSRRELTIADRTPSPARKFALTLLQSLRDAEAPGFDTRLDDARRTGGMSGQDVALSREIAFGVARQRRWLESVLDRYLHHPLPEQAHQVLDALLVGIYQAAFLDRVPAHTIVDETVKLVASVRTEVGYRSLANAIMRRVVKEQRADLQPTADTPWMTRHGVPDWLASEAGQLYRGDELVEFFAASNELAPLCLRATQLAHESSDEELEQLLRAEIADYTHSIPELVRSPLVPRSFSVRTRGLTPEHLPSFRRGLFTVEDEGGQVASYLAGVRPGMKVLDLCASPGGKTANLADLAGRKLERFVACDVSEQKLVRLRDTIKRLCLGEMIETRLSGTVTGEGFDGAFDLVLVDAPCSGLGTLRRHPEIRWKRSPRDLRALARQQQQLLEQGAALVSPGGTLVYSVCTFTKLETEGVVEKFVAAQEGRFALAEAPEGLPFDAARLAVGAGQWRTSPHRDGCDGFFVGRLRREK
jgi:16S rRNA (cytosine967-C5)-methyltransferase